MNRIALVFFFMVASIGLRSATLTSNGTQEDVAAKVALANNGDTVTIPSGTFAWTTSLSINKAITLQGGGAGGFRGYSTSTIVPGNGTFDIVMQASGLDFSAGQTVRAIWKADARTYVQGTVISYVGNVLKLSVNTFGLSPKADGPGRSQWTVAVMPNTIIYNNAVSGFNDSMIYITESTITNIIITGIKFDVLTGVQGQHIIVNSGGASGKPVIIRYCWFGTDGRLGRSIQIFVNRGLVHNCSFDTGFDVGNGNGQQHKDNQGIAITALGSTNTSWSTASTMGTADTTGRNNVYIETCYFAGYPNQACDFSTGSRSVLRYCTMDNAPFASHGLETAPQSMRHLEVYNCNFVFNNMGTWTYPMSRWMLLRGGTGAFHDNIIPDITSFQFGDKAEVHMTIEALRRPTQFINCPTVYPISQQIGQGHNGSALALEPLYFWNNGSSYAVAPFDGCYSDICGACDCCGHGNLQTGSYVLLGRDYYVGTPKPSYTPYGYPHPLAGGTNVMDTSPVGISQQPTNRTVSVGTSVQFVVGVTGAPPILYKWKKAGTAIPGATATIYDLGNAQLSDDADYTVAVTNAYGTALSSVAHLTVNAASGLAPTISVQPQSISRTEGENANFSVTASGDNPLKYYWRLNGTVLGGMNLDANNISIVMVNTGMSGRQYSVIVSNSVGTVTSSNALLTVSAAPAGPTRYVDFTAGDDSNTGTQASPWKRCPGMLGWEGSAILSPGDTVYFDRSDIWTIGPTNLNGPGFDLRAGVHYIGNVFDPEGAGSGLAVLRITNYMECGVARIWEDDATYPTWLDAFDVDGNGQVASGVDINHAFWRQGLTKGVKRVQSCIVHGNTGDGSTNAYRYGIIVSDNSPDGSGWVSGLEIIGNTITNTPRDAIAIYPGPSGRVANILVQQNEVWGIATDPSYGQGHGITCKGNVQNAQFIANYIHDVRGSAIFFDGSEFFSQTLNYGPSNVSASANILGVIPTSNNGVIRFFTPSGNPGISMSVSVFANIVLPNSALGGLSFGGFKGTNVDVKIYNNTFVHARIDIGNPTLTTSTIDFRNNVIIQSNAVPFTDSGSDVTSHGYNVYYRTDGGVFASQGGTSYTTANFLGWESTGSTNDPVFLNASSLPTGFTGTFAVNLTPNTTGLQLNTNSSPAFNTGIALGASYAASIGTVQRSLTGTALNWDRGAYEQGQVEMPVPPQPGPTNAPSVLSGVKNGNILIFDVTQ